MIRIVCYGLGAGFDGFLRFMDPSKAEIIGVIDKSKGREGYRYLNLDELSSVDYDYIVICSSTYYNEMLANLVLEGVQLNKIVNSCFCLMVDELSYNVMKGIARPNIRRLIHFLPDPLETSKTSDNLRIMELYMLAEMMHKEKIEGDLAEVGVFQGRFARQISKLFPEKNIFLFDTFESFDHRDLGDDFSLNNFLSIDTYQALRKTSVETVLENMPYKDKCMIMKGYFPETAIGIPNDTRFAFVSLDADLYNPTLSGLEFFYPRLSKGGIIMVHDYNMHMFPGVACAVDEFASKYSLFPIPIPDNCGSVLIMRHEK